MADYQYLSVISVVPKSFVNDYTNVKRIGRNSVGRILIFLRQKCVHIVFVMNFVYDTATSDKDIVPTRYEVYLTGYPIFRRNSANSSVNVCSQGYDSVIMKTTAKIIIIVTMNHSVLVFLPNLLMIRLY